MKLLLDGLKSNRRKNSQYPTALVVTVEMYELPDPSALRRSTWLPSKEAIVKLESAPDQVGLVEKSPSEKSSSKFTCCAKESVGKRTKNNKMIRFIPNRIIEVEHLINSKIEAKK